MVLKRLAIFINIHEKMTNALITEFIEKFLCWFLFECFEKYNHEFIEKFLFWFLFEWLEKYNHT